MPKRPITTTLTLLMCAAGCSSQDERLAVVSRESLARQAEQNQTMARQSEQIAQATHALVEADAKAHQAVIQLQTDLQRDAQAERVNLDRQHDNLENERRQVAQDRRSDPIIAAAILNAAMVVAGLLPLLLAWCVIRALRHEPADAELGALLVQELVAEQPLVLPPSLANASHSTELAHDPSPSLPQLPAIDQTS